MTMIASMEMALLAYFLSYLPLLQGEKTRHGSLNNVIGRRESGDEMESKSEKEKVQYEEGG